MGLVCFNDKTREAKSIKIHFPRKITRLANTVNASSTTLQLEDSAIRSTESR